MDTQLLVTTTDRRILRGIMHKLRAGIRSIYKENAPDIRLYGSYARGDANPGSDIDVLLIYPEKVRQAEEIRRLGALLADINLQYQVLISLLPTDVKEYRHSPIGFWKNVRRESKPIEAI
jgi:uncharacterized protein